MKAQVINGKIIAIGESIIDSGNGDVFSVDADFLPKTDDGELDYEKIFNSEIEIVNDTIIFKHE